MIKVSCVLSLIFLVFSSYAQSTSENNLNAAAQIEAQKTKMAKEIARIEIFIRKNCNKSTPEENSNECTNKEDKLYELMAGQRSQNGGTNQLTHEQQQCKEKFEKLEKIREKAFDSCGDAGLPSLGACSKAVKNCDGENKDCPISELKNYKIKNKELETAEKNKDKADDKINDINDDIIKAQQDVIDANTAIEQARLDKTNALEKLQNDFQKQGQTALADIVQREQLLDKLTFEIQDLKDALPDLDDTEQMALTDIKLGCVDQALKRQQDGRQICLKNKRVLAATGRLKTKDFGSFFSSKKAGMCSVQNAKKYRKKYKRECLTSERTIETFKRIKRDTRRKKKLAQKNIERKELGKKEVEKELDRIVEQNKLRYSNDRAKIISLGTEMELKITSARQKHQIEQTRLAQLQENLRKAMSLQNIKTTNYSNLQNQIMKIKDEATDNNLDLEKIDKVDEGFRKFSQYKSDAGSFGLSCCNDNYADNGSLCNNYYQEPSAGKLKPASDSGLRSGN